MLAIELVQPAASPQPIATQALARPGHAAGLLVLTVHLPERAPFPPPLVIDDATLTRGLDILSAAFPPASLRPPPRPDLLADLGHSYVSDLQARTMP